MAGNWSEPLPLMDAAMCNRMIRTTDEYLQAINWRNDGDADTLEELVEIAKAGKDIGLERTIALRPKNRIFAQWMHWNSVVTYLYNRDTNVRTLLSALRKIIK